MQHEWDRLLKLEGKRLLGRLGHEWKRNVKTDIKMEHTDVNWIHVAHDRVE
jgi:hypothetical protein